MKKAVIELGSNSIRFALASVIGNCLYDFCEEIEYTRLADGYMDDMSLSGKPLKRSVDIAEMFYHKAIKEGAESIRITATAAIRNASNQEYILHLIERACGVCPQVLTEKEEALAGYKAIMIKNHYDNPLLLDIGGGSTELTWKSKEGLLSYSLPIGALSLSKKINPNFYIKNKTQFLEDFDFSNVSDLVGTGGSITTLVMIADELETFEDKLVNRRELSINEIKTVRDYLNNLSVDQRNHVIGLPQSRRDTIIFGIDILLTVMESTRFDFLSISTDDGLKGLLLDI